MRPAIYALGNSAIRHGRILERALRDVARELVDDLAGLRVGKQESRNG